MVIRKRMLARRTFLGGVGAAVALPWLDAMVPALGAAPQPGLRLGFVYVPNGVFLPNWLPTGNDTTFELSRTLKSLEPVRNRLVVISGLSNRQAAIGAGGGAHSKCSTALPRTARSGRRPTACAWTFNVCYSRARAIRRSRRARRRRPRDEMSQVPLPEF